MNELKRVADFIHIGDTLYISRNAITMDNRSGIGLNALHMANYIFTVYSDGGDGEFVTFKKKRGDAYSSQSLASLMMAATPFTEYKWV